MDFTKSGKLKKKAGSPRNVIGIKDGPKTSTRNIFAKQAVSLLQQKLAGTIRSPKMNRKFACSPDLGKEHKEREFEKQKILESGADKYTRREMMKQLTEQTPQLRSPKNSLPQLVPYKFENSKEKKGSSRKPEDEYIERYTSTASTHSPSCSSTIKLQPLKSPGGRQQAMNESVGQCGSMSPKIRNKSTLINDASETLFSA